MAQGIERFSAPPPGDDFDATDEARFRRLIEQFMENADYRVRDVGDDVESIDSTVSDHESRITTLEGASGLTVIDSGAATVTGGATTVVTSDPAIGSGSIGLCVVSRVSGGDFNELGSQFQLHDSSESSTISARVSTDSAPMGVGVLLHGQHPGTPHHYDLQIAENSGGTDVDLHYVIAELIV